MTPLTIDDLNRLDRDAFVSAIGWVFEQSPWVAERAWAHRPFRSVDHLHATMLAELAAAGREDQLALLRAHPDLGSRTTMTEASAVEQKNAGLDNLSAEEHARLQALNAEYRRRFGFPFLYAVKGSSSRDILGALESRTPAAPEQELAEALRQVSRIARFRLEDTVS